MLNRTGSCQATSQASYTPLPYMTRCSGGTPAQHRPRWTVAAAAAAAGSGTGAPHITLIATDVDGTLLDSKQQLSPGNEAAIKQSAAAGVPLIVATGKARGPWVGEVVPRLGPAMPGVFIQGLLVCDAQGKVLYSRSLEAVLVKDCIHLADQLSLTLTAYCGDRILCSATDEQTDRLLFYREPSPEGVGDMEEQVVGRIDVQKLIFMASVDRIAQVRPLIEQQLQGRASITTAIPGMLELLPLGASKGAGVAWLLDHLGMSPSSLMALGDGENDIEMLQMAGWGVAMSNAGPGLKAVADVVVGSNDEGGVAQAIQRYVLEPRGLTAAAATAAAAGTETA